MSWSPGDTVVLREVWDGRVWQARPAVVVSDAEDEQRFYVPPGTVAKYPVDEHGNWLLLPSRDWTLADVPWRGSAILSFAWPRVPYAVLLFWDSERFAGFYVNLQEPLRRTRVGFDTFDHCLDVLVAADRSSWEWKDEDELEEALRLGLFTDEQARGFREAGERAARRIVDGEPPFDRDWSAWRPDPAWPVPTFPVGWDLVEP
jgi:predicted RNA-binding protein associated with RNAse of E/G family